MYVGFDFDPLQSDEKDSFSFDFVNDVAPGETLLSAAWTCAVFSASAVDDPDAATRIVGTATVDGGTITSQFVGNDPVPGCTYVLQAVAETSLGKTVTLWSKFLCQDAPVAA